MSGPGGIVVCHKTLARYSQGWNRQPHDTSQLTTLPGLFGSSLPVARSHLGHCRHIIAISSPSASSASSDLLSTSYLPIPHTPLFHHTFLRLPLPSQLSSLWPQVSSTELGTNRTTHVLKILFKTQRHGQKVCQAVLQT